MAHALICAICNSEISYPDDYYLRVVFDNKDSNEFAHIECIPEPMEAWCEVARHSR